MHKKVKMMCATISWRIFLQKNVFRFFINTADMAVQMSSFANLDIFQMSSKFVCNFYNKKIFMLSRLDKA